VAKDDSSHYFSKSLAEHNRAVRKFILQHEETGLD
jgi:cell division protein YceG involved in septum cleavage